MSPPRKRVAIVGAGASGLAAARHALLYEVEPVVLELSREVGGLWNYKPQETDEASVMKSTVINTSKEMTAFSDFPPPSHFANFMHNRRMHEYLQKYAENFDLIKHVKFEHKVLNVQRSPSYAETGTWIVTYKSINDNNERNEEFDGVLLCTGHHTEPFWPAKWPGQDSFRGTVTHAHSYKDHRGFEDKVVAVVGVGNSGVDIAVELSRISKQVYLITRRGTWVLHRNLDRSIPFDLMLNNRFIYMLQAAMPSWIASGYLQSMVEKRFDHAKFGLKPSHGILAAHWTVNDELPNRLSCGTILVKPNIQTFTETGLIFLDGSETKNVDEVILSTGYSFGFPLAEGGKLIPVVENEVELYQNMFPLTTSDHNTLAVIGLIQPLGSIMPISEMQARVFFDVLTNGSCLPSRMEMEFDIDMKKRDMEERYVKSRRHTIQVDYVTYMDELASLIGCEPQPWRYLLTDPQLAYRLVWGPNAPYVYRLRGPKPWHGAREAILTLGSRARKMKKAALLTIMNCSQKRIRVPERCAIE
ncbi:flavin-binding monooxygenase-like domain-containing protein [Ditylenchus destructor]|nr:flavin-binding monooxygenase-like domain-containing protein [Ditylenchus destructor]